MVNEEAVIKQIQTIILRILERFEKGELTTEQVAELAKSIEVMLENKIHSFVSDK